MLKDIIILTFFIFAVLYPLCFWISFKDPLKDKFHKFHLGLPNVIGGVLLVFILFSNTPLSIKIYVVLWKAALLSISRFYWKKEYPHAPILTIASLLGLLAYLDYQNFLVGSNLKINCISILSGCILCLTIFTMNLGHWYLNVHGLPMKHIKNSVTILWALIILRALWDAYYFVTSDILFDGEMIPLANFLLEFEGFLLFIAIFFGTVFPLIAMYFVKEILKLKNTQAATGMMYVILCSVLIGDLSYKFYLFKYGIAL